jgi:proteasome assembly chaperone (PAC2) family protein
MNIPNEWATAILGGGGLSAVMTYVSGRKHGQADFINAVNKAAEQVIERLQAECVRMEARCEALETREEQCRKDLAQVREEIRQLMERPVPPYTLGPSK